MIEANNKAKKYIFFPAGCILYANILMINSTGTVTSSTANSTKVKEFKWAQRQALHFSCSAASAVTKCYFKVLLQNPIKCRKQCRDLVTNFSIMNKHAELCLYLLL